MDGQPKNTDINRWFAEVDPDEAPGDIFTALITAGRDNSSAESKPQRPSVTTNTAALFDAYVERLERGEGDILFDLPSPLDRFEVGPGLLTVLGAGPGSGKTALAGQLVFEALERNPELQITIANAEMPFEKLAERELIRRTTVRSDHLRFANLEDSDLYKIREASQALRPLLSRLDWLKPPHKLKTLQELDDQRPGLLVVDYLQKFAPDGEPRVAVNTVMGYLRELCHLGWAVLAISSTSRIAGKGGSSHAGKALNLASFRESGEIEFNVDAAYLLRNHGEIGGKSWLKDIELACVKNRHGECHSERLEFNAAGMRFRKAAEKPEGTPGPFNFGQEDDEDPMEGYQDA